VQILHFLLFPAEPCTEFEFYTTVYPTGLQINCDVAACHPNFAGKPIHPPHVQDHKIFGIIPADMHCIVTDNSLLTAGMQVLQ
jgi:hypothetical protein